MVFLYLTLVIPIALASFLLVLAWYIIIAGYKSPNLHEIPYIHILFFGSFIIALLLSWAMIFFVLPTSVGVTWYFVTLTVVLGGLTIIICTPHSRLHKIIAVGLLVIIGINWRYSGLFVLFAIMLSAMLVPYITMHWRQTTIKPHVLISVLLLSMLIFSGNQLLYTSHDNAQYFDSLLVYDRKLPLTNAVDVVDVSIVSAELARQIMQQNNVFGRGTVVAEVGLGMMNHSTYWIGAVTYDNNRYFDNELNMYVGFLAVNYSDPYDGVKVIPQKFYIGESLVANRDLHHVIYDNDTDYLIDKSYFSMSSSGEMRLLVPYVVQAKPMFGAVTGAGIITQEIQLLGGVLEYTASGEQLHNYQNLENLPPYASYYYYCDNWVNRMTTYWGASYENSHEFDVLTHLFGSASLIAYPASLIRSSGVYQQNVLLTDDAGEHLRGLIKANQSGFYYYDWSAENLLGPGDVIERLRNLLADSVRNSLLQVATLVDLYPAVDNPQTLGDYVYVVKLQQQSGNFGGIALVNPTDTTWQHTILLTTDDETTPAAVITTALNDYRQGTSIGTGNFTISEQYNYVEHGSTVYIMNGLLNATINRTIIFSQEYIKVKNEWVLVVESEPGDMLYVEMILLQGNFYAIHVSMP